MSSPSKVIFITGATSGFGAATARLFATNGWRVVATGRRLERLEALQSEFESGQIHIAQMDLTDRESIVVAVAGLPDAFKPITCLFNNGGLALGSNPVPDIRLEDWRNMVETNIMGLIHTTLELLDLLKATGRGATIFNVGSVAGRFAYPGGNVYGGTKAFVHQFSLNLRTDLAGTGIRITSFEPGMGKTEFTKVRTYGDDEANERFYDNVEPILPEDVADMVWYVANLPAHLNINVLELMPVCQVPARPLILRDT
jgi:NADP-dependent 3-hydroxy acid dehydrogenase YdfG